MRPELRAQLRRHKARPRSTNPFWRQVSGINVPWAVGQRRWMAGKIRESMGAVFASVYSKPRPDTLMISADAFSAYKSELMHQEVEQI